MEAAGAAGRTHDGAAFTQTGLVMMRREVLGRAHYADEGDLSRGGGAEGGGGGHCGVEYSGFGGVNLNLFQYVLTGARK